MTAEIAILNRTAVALAADSIVTLFSSTGSKTYDSAEKIFDLSRRQPIGLMVYNNTELLRIPIEILAREFREQITDDFANLFEVWPQFQKFLLKLGRETSSEFEIEDSKVLFESLIGAELQALSDVFRGNVMERISQTGSPSVEELLLLLENIIDAVITNANNNKIEKFLSDISPDDFAEVYGETTTRQINSIVIPLLVYFQIPIDESVTDRLQSKIHELAFTLVQSKRRSPAFTGLVFAGYGGGDRFASLHSVEIDGVYFGKIRIIDSKKVDIDRSGKSAAIVPFAQRDMPERFIYGIDQEFEEKLKMIAENSFELAIDSIAIGSFDEEKKKQIITAVMGEFIESVELQKDMAAKELQSVVNHLSKKELGEVAYSLVELTSRKQRYSSEMETVGGPIDVAILTRNEGFIWVRRKRYFDVEMNPVYLERLKEAMKRKGRSNV